MRIGICALSGVVALVITAPSASADPAAPPPPPADDVTIHAVAGDPAAPPPPPPADDVTIHAVAGDPAAPPPPPPADDVTIHAVAGDPAAPPAEVPHLASPENLPPGTTNVPPPQGRGLSYLRELWHALQTQEVSGADAFLLLTQRRLDPHAAPPPGMPAGPQPLLPPEPPPLPPEPPPLPPEPPPTP